MRPRVLHFLRCPKDRGPLELRVWESSPSPLSSSDRQRAEASGIDPKSLETQIKTGVLLNPRLRTFYPIYLGVPRMLLFPTAISARFMDEFGSRVATELQGYALPSDPSRPGEEAVIKTFSTEWLNYDWDPSSYWDLKAEDMFRNMRYLIDLETNPVNGKSVMEVGIGIGAWADNVAREEKAELFGIDLSYAVDAAYRNFGSNPFLHIVQASAFNVPVADASFDLVYSHGVLHHTYSTKTAFESIARVPKPGGRCYLWVYSPFQESRTLGRKILYAVEKFYRPFASRLPETLQTAALVPLIPLYLFHQHVLVKPGSQAVGYGRFGWRESIHAARDRFTPRYAHRHTDEEVRSWFKDAGYEGLYCISERPQPDFLHVTMKSCTAVIGRRSSNPKKSGKSENNVAA
jgi:SAM-dependent methyltransferase/uncharacterized protein YbaR (Trm112 family)